MVSEVDLVERFVNADSVATVLAVCTVALTVACVRLYGAYTKMVDKVFEIVRTITPLMSSMKESASETSHQSHHMDVVVEKLEGMIARLESMTKKG